MVGPFIGILSHTPRVEAKEALNFKNTQSLERENKPFIKTIEEAQAHKEKEMYVTKKERATQVKKAESLLRSKADVMHGLKEDKPNLEHVEALIMALLTTQVGLSEEEVTNLLKKEGVTPLALTEQETFRQFIMTALGQDEMGLLKGDVDISALGELWKQIQTVQATYYSEGEKVVEEIHLSEGQVIDKTQTVHSLPEESELATMPFIPEGLETEKPSKQREQKNEINPLTIDEVPTTDLGMTLPIYETLKEQSVKAWQINLLTPTSDVASQVEVSIHTQLIEGAQYTELESGKELELQLAPKELGKLTLKMVEQNGMMTAQIKVEQDKTKDLILENLAALREGLEKQGLVIQDVQVEVRKDTHQSNMEMAKQKSSKRVQDIIAKHMNEVLEEEAHSTQPRNSLTSIELDYQA